MRSTPRGAIAAGSLSVLFCWSLRANQENTPWGKRFKVSETICTSVHQRTATVMNCLPSQMKDSDIGIGCAAEAIA